MDEQVTEVPGGAPHRLVDDDEDHKLDLMRSILKAKSPADSKEVDDETLRRFLRARNWDVDKASAMFLKHQKWRLETVPNGFISPSEVQNELPSDKLFMQGSDKLGRPIAVLFAAKHFTATRDLDLLKRFTVYCLDKICSRIPQGQEKFICVGDLKGWGYLNCDIRGYLAVLDIMQSYYPERLGKAFLVNVPYLFMKAWQIVYPFIDENTRKKIVFVADGQITETLLEDIDEDQIPDVYGGKMQLSSMD